MARCYNVPVTIRQPNIPAQLPFLWLVSDARNDARIERVLARLPRGSGLIFRHYHLTPPERRARFEALSRTGRRFGHVIVLAGDVAQARAWRAQGVYGSPAQGVQGPRILRLATAHGLRELASAHRARADAVLLSPVFATASHPGGRPLGPIKARLLAARAQMPVIALGGMTMHRARAHRIARWAAIDGLS